MMGFPVDSNLFLRLGSATLSDLTTTMAPTHVEA